MKCLHKNGKNSPSKILTNSSKSRCVSSRLIVKNLIGLCHVTKTLNDFTETCVIFLLAAQILCGGFGGDNVLVGRKMKRICCFH